MNYKLFARALCSVIAYFVVDRIVWKALVEDALDGLSKDEEEPAAIVPAQSPRVPRLFVAAPDCDRVELTRLPGVYARGYRYDFRVTHELAQRQLGEFAFHVEYDVPLDVNEHVANGDSR